MPSGPNYLRTYVLAESLLLKLWQSFTEWTKIDKKVQLRKAPTPCLPLKVKLESTGFFST